jgi:hypothetical protein
MALTEIREVFFWGGEKASFVHPTRLSHPRKTCGGPKIKPVH